jgi:hypothetical protein
LHIGIRKEERERRKEGVKKVKWGKGNRGKGNTESGKEKGERRKEQGEKQIGNS